MIILSIDTSCDETAAAITNDRKVISNIVWSQATAHAKFGGVMPSLAQRMHEERIDWVIQRALKISKTRIEKVDVIAVTIGPGLSIALGVGVNKAIELAKKYNKPLFPVNHVEAHLLSPFATPNTPNASKNIEFPAVGLCVSGKNTELVLIKNVGQYEILAESIDDAIGESIDKAARMLGLGYPGGKILEDFAKKGDPSKFKLPIPLIGQEKRRVFSYSGLKTSFYRLIDSGKKVDENFPTKENIYDLAATYQNAAFKHIERVADYCLKNLPYTPKYFLLGGGVAVNTELKLRLRNLGKKFGFTVHIPYVNKLCGDNAAMIGVTAYLKIAYGNLNLEDFFDYTVDRDPKLKIIP